MTEPDPAAEAAWLAPEAMAARAARMPDAPRVTTLDEIDARVREEESHALAQVDAVERAVHGDDPIHVRRATGRDRQDVAPSTDVRAVREGTAPQGQVRDVDVIAAWLTERGAGGMGEAADLIDQLAEHGYQVERDRAVAETRKPAPDDTDRLAELLAVAWDEGAAGASHTVGVNPYRYDEALDRVTRTTGGTD